MKIYIMESVKTSGNENPQDAIGRKGNHLYGDKYEAVSNLGANGVALSPRGQSFLRDKKSTQAEENRIGFLNQCKLELSAEVIRWKEESLKMQKEKEASEQKIQDLQSLVSKLTNKNSELESSLLSSLRENERLKMHSLAVDEENFVLHQKLSKTFTKYHSYPWCDMLNKSLEFPCNASVHRPPKVNTQESWEEVSQRLLNQMKQEMKELHKLGQRITLEDSSFEPSVYVTVGKAENCDDLENSLMDNMTNLKTQMEYLKQHLEEQKQKLETLTNLASQDADNTLPSCDIADHAGQHAIPTSQETNLHNVDEHEPNEKQFVRPSDESFREYFTRQLNNSKSAEELRKMMEFYLQGDKEYSEKKCNEKENRNKLGSEIYSSTSELPVKKSLPADSSFHSKQNMEKSPMSQSQKLNTGRGIESREREKINQLPPEEERVCPICEAVFPKVISQKDFESHVVAHLEAECASILDQYEIL